METVNVALGARSYDILIEDRLLDGPREHLAPFARDGRLLVVSDETVWNIAWRGACRRVLAKSRPCRSSLPPGEASKSWAGPAVRRRALLGHGVERSDHVVAFGGGVVGDLAGFAAAIVNRGCSFVQIPTTLLAQVDSSVGGKTAINVAAGKNLVGAFHQPSLVLIDPTVARHARPPAQVRAGYAEIVKYALIEDAALFDWLEREGRAVLAGDPTARTHAIAAAVAGKARIVEQDERETTGRRALLNLGHTFGHALEAETGYSDRLLHGEAVALGCVLAFDFSVERGLCAPTTPRRVRAHFESVGLPTTLAALGSPAGATRLAAHMRSDKKRRAAGPRSSSPAASAKHSSTAGGPWRSRRIPRPRRLNGRRTPKSSAIRSRSPSRR